MIKIHRFPFNDFQVNTYVVYDDTKDCIIFDPGMYYENEKDTLTDFIASNNLKPVLLVNTHAHIDHIIANDFIAKKYQIKLAAHEESQNFLKHAKEYGRNFGIELDEVKPIDIFIDEEKPLKFGNSELQILYTPGHADGSLCFYAKEADFVITGDVLFFQSIGRTDLPTGNYDLLQESIWEKLFTLPEKTTVYPGHGPETTIGYEKLHNPFVAIGKDLS
jgi:glyoxylase-like metal-dependent hydrolase (beta-lactamase superfamily II)